MISKQSSTRLDDRSEREKEEERERRRATRSGGSGRLGTCAPGQRAPSTRKFLIFSNTAMIHKNLQTTNFITSSLRIFSLLYDCKLVQFSSLGWQLETN